MSLYILQFIIVVSLSLFKGRTGLAGYKLVKWPLLQFLGPGQVKKKNLDVIKKVSLDFRIVAVLEGAV